MSGLQIKILKDTSQELKLEIAGEGHTLCNLLEKTLLEDETVEIAGYDIPHPLTSNTILYIRTKEGRDPKEALKEALERIAETGRSLREAFEEALEEWRKAEGK